MRRWATLAALVVLLAPARANAMGAVVGRDGETATVGSARVAVATAQGRTTLWAQVSVEGVGEGFAWIVPVPSGARIDLASDAWLDALDAATAPVILAPPPSGESCDAGSLAQRVPPSTSAQSTRPTMTALFADAASLGSFLSSAGYPLPSGLASRLDPLLSAGQVVLVSTYASSRLPPRTLRVTYAGAPALPFTLTPIGPSGAPVTAFAIASAGATAGASPLVVDPSSILWEADGGSTYVSDRLGLLQQWGGERWLTETASPTLFFVGAPVDAGPSLPSVLGSYFTLAAAYGDTTGDASDCATAARATNGEPGDYESECPQGALGVAPGPSPCAAAEGGGVPIAPPLCAGTADDAALAVAALPDTDVWITRIDGLLTAASASSVPVTVAPTPAFGPVVTASGYAFACATSPDASASEPPAPPPSPVVPPAPTTYAPSTPPPSQGPAVAQGAGAVGAAAGSDACGATGGSDDGSDGSGCASDPSPGSSDDGSNDGSGCGSSDPSSGSSDDGSSDGSGCGSSGSSSNDCTTQGRAGRARGRSPVSRGMFLLAAGLAVARRRGRPAKA
jgi:hypothetical protein